MSRVATIGFFIAIFISSTSYANSSASPQALEWGPTRQAAETYRSCLSNAYYSEARVSSERARIAQSALDTCASEKLSFLSVIEKMLPTKTENEKKSLQQVANSIASDAEKRFVDDLHAEIEEKISGNLQFLAIIRSAMYNCPNIDWKRAINSYSFATYSLSNDYAYYGNSTENRKRDLAKAIGQTDAEIAEIGSEQWCLKTKTLFDADAVKNMSPFQ